MAGANRTVQRAQRVQLHRSCFIQHAAAQLLLRWLTAYAGLLLAACTACSRRHRVPRLLDGQSRTPSSQAMWAVCLHTTGSFLVWLTDGGAAKQLPRQLPSTGTVPALTLGLAALVGCSAQEVQGDRAGGLAPHLRMHFHLARGLGKETRHRRQTSVAVARSGCCCPSP